MYQLANMRNLTRRLSRLLVISAMLLLPQAVRSQAIFDGGGNGSADSPYIISTPTDLLRLCTWINDGTLEGDEYFEVYSGLQYLDCTNLTNYVPAGTANHPFRGRFNGNNVAITDLKITVDASQGYNGFFGYIAGGMVSNLRLSRATVKEGNESGVVAGCLNGGTITGCTVASCSLSTSNTQSLQAGGVVGQLLQGEINNCLVDGTTINGTSTYMEGACYSDVGGIVGLVNSGADKSAVITSCAISSVAVPTTILSKLNYPVTICAGGIVGRCEGASITISNNQVTAKAGTHIYSVNENEDHYGENRCGAIVGSQGDATFSNNTYTYPVTTSTSMFNEEAQEKVGNESRGTGVYDNGYDIVDDHGVVLYTKTVTAEGVLCGFEGEWYGPLSDDGNRKFAVAPGQTAEFYLYPPYSYVLSSVTLSYVPTKGEDPTVVNLVNEGEDGEYLYRFEMPDADATLTITGAPEGYLGVTVAGVPVTTANASDITGNAIWGNKLSFDADKNILTMDYTTIDLEDEDGAIAIESTIPNLTIHLIGGSMIYTNASAPVFIKYTGEVGDTSPRLTFTTEGFMDDGYYWLGELSVNGVTSLAQVTDGYTITNNLETVTENITGLSQNLTSGWKCRVYDDEPIVSIWNLEVYDLWIGTGRVISSDLRASQDSYCFNYNPENNALCFTGEVSLAVKSSMPNLNIEVYDTEGKLTAVSNETAAITFVPTDNVPTGTLTFVLAEYANPDDTNSFEIDNAGGAVSGFSAVKVTAPMWFAAPTPLPNMWDSSVTRLVVSDFVQTGITVTNANGHDVMITNRNHEDVLGDGTVFFDGNRRLTLENANLQKIVVGSSSTLTPANGLEVMLLSDNTIANAGEGAIVSQGTTASLPLTFINNSTGNLKYSNTNTAVPFNTVAEAFQGFSPIDYQGVLTGMVEKTSTLNTVTIGTALAPIVDNDTGTPATMQTAIDYGNTSMDATTILNGVVNNNVFYNLRDNGTPESDGFDHISGEVVINSFMTDAEAMTVAHLVLNGALIPFSSDATFCNIFKGVVFLLPSGSFILNLKARAEVGHELHMIIGTTGPIKIKTDNPNGFSYPYYSSTESYVFLYHVEVAPSAPQLAQHAPRIGPKTSVSTGLQGLNVTAGMVSEPPTASPYAMLDMAKIQRLGGGSHGIVVSDGEATDIPNGAFAGTSSAPGFSPRPAAQNISFIDLSGTKITGKVYKHGEGAFAGVPASTLIYLPAGNYVADNDANFVIGGICDKLQLSTESETSFEVHDNFVAGNAQIDLPIGTNERATTVYLPFAIANPDEYGEFYEFNKMYADNGAVNMKPVEGGLEANKPYLFVAKQNGPLSLIQNSAQIAKPTTTVSDAFKGAYEKKSLANAYTFAPGTEVKGTFVQATGDVKPFTAYIDSNAGTPVVSLTWGGDVDRNNVITITDAVGVVNKILDQPSANFNVKAADLNGDYTISITDAVNVVNIILDSRNVAAPALDPVDDPASEVEPQ